MAKICIFFQLLFFIPFTLKASRQDTVKIHKMETVTIVGNKNKSIPGSGQYIGVKTLEKLNQPNINSILKTIPGVNVRDEEGFGLRPNIGLRGTSVNRSARITLMEDGILIAPAPYADPSAYYFPTLARMRGVEVLKGSSQIKYGPYTIGGAVNLLSTDIPSSFQGLAQFSLGSFMTNQQRIWVGDSHKNFDYVFEINRLASNGFKELDNGGNTGFDRRDFMGKMRWHTDDDAAIPQSLTLKVVNSTEDGNETYLGLTFDDYRENPFRRYAGTSRDKLDMSHQHLSLQYSIRPAAGLTVNATGYYATTFRDWARANTFGNQSINTILNDPSVNQAAYAIMTGRANGDISYQSAARTYFSKGIQLHTNYVFTTRDVDHVVHVGLRYHEDQADRLATRSTYNMDNGTMILTEAGIPGNQENQIRHAAATAAFIRYDFQYKGLKVSPGVRYEKIHFLFQQYGTRDNARTGINLQTAENDIVVFLPGLGLYYEINQRWNVFGGIHRGFSPPGMPSLTSAEVQAKAESSVNYELGSRYESEGISIQATGFLNNYDNILGSDNVSGGGAGTGDMFNAGKAIIRGLEFSAEYNLLQHIYKTSRVKLPVTLVYTYTSAVFGETFRNGGGDWGSGIIHKGDFLPFITPHVFSGMVGFEHTRFDVTLTGRYTGQTSIKPMQDDYIFPASDISLDAINALPGFLIIDASANFHFRKNFTAFVAVNNMTNNTAIVSNLPQGYRPNMPASFLSGIKVHFHTKK